MPQAEVQSLPLNGRNFLDLALLIPGVSPTNVGSTQLFAETSAVAGQGISIASQRNLSNSFIVDGLSANDDAAGLSGMPYGLDAVEQFQVVTSGGQAELGRALGGYISVVTKSGTNAVHGTVYDFTRDDNFNGRNALSGTKLPMNQQQYGGSLGGPIARESNLLLLEHRTAAPRSNRPGHDPSAESADHQRETDCGRLPGCPGDDRRISQPGAQRQPAWENRPPVQRHRPVLGQVQPLSRHLRPTPEVRGR